MLMLQLLVNEHYGDTSRMFCVGKVSVKVNNLINATYELYDESH